jgi:hypothetical protein
MSEPLTNEEIAELRRLEREATPGPWSVVDPPWRSTDDMPWIVRGHGDPHGAEPVCDLAIQGDGEDGGGYNAEADARLIAKARSALPRLLDLAESRSSPAREPRADLASVEGRICHECGTGHYKWFGGGAFSPGLYCDRCKKPPPPAREPGLRERVEALAVEWETEAARRDRDASRVTGQQRKALRLGASFERNHAAALRRALAGETRPDPLRRMADRFSDPSLRAAAHAGLDAGETREAPGTPAADPGAQTERLPAARDPIGAGLGVEATCGHPLRLECPWCREPYRLVARAPSSGEDAATRSCLWHSDCAAADRALHPHVTPSHPPSSSTPSTPAKGG